METIIDADYADYLVHLANTPQAKSLLHSLKQAASEFGLCERR